MPSCAAYTWRRLRRGWGNLGFLLILVAYVSSFRGGLELSRLTRGKPRLCMSTQGPHSSDSEMEFCARRLNDLVTVQAMRTATQYWLELRGNMYAEWLVRYTESQGGVEVIGWKAFLEGMLRAPVEEIVVKKLVKKPRGGSGTNPYLADRKPVEYSETLEPATIARRIMEIREQMAGHLMQDLELVAAENAELRRYYADEVELGTDEALKLRAASWQPRLEHDPSSGMANPPQRGAAYDGAIELVTAASIRRVRSELRIRGDRHTLSWLERFSDKELGKRGNDLVEALLNGPMVMVSYPNRSRPKFIEPLKVAKAIMVGREAVAQECIRALEMVPGEHSRLTVSLLNEKWKASPENRGGE